MKTQRMPSTVRECLRPPEVRREARNRSPSQRLEALHTSSPECRFLSSRTEKRQMSVIQATQLMALRFSSPRKLTQWQVDLSRQSCEGR